MLSEALNKTYRNSAPNFKVMIEIVCEIHHFMSKIGHAFDEVIGQDRVYSFDTDEYYENVEFEIETNVYNRNYAYERISPPSKDDTNEFEEFGISQFT